jgi:Cbb3-type cytochrome oxidase component FixQ
MDWASILYLGITFLLFGVFALIVVRTYSKKRRKTLEEPKHRMLDDD